MSMQENMDEAARNSYFFEQRNREIADMSGCGDHGVDFYSGTVGSYPDYFMQEGTRLAWTNGTDEVAGYAIAEAPDGGNAYLSGFHTNCTFPASSANVRMTIFSGQAGKICAYDQQNKLIGNKQDIVSCNDPQYFVFGDPGAKIMITGVSNGDAGTVMIRSIAWSLPVSATGRDREE